MNTNVLDVIMQTVTWMHTGCTDFVEIFELVPVTQKELNFFGYSAKKNELLYFYAYCVIYTAQLQFFRTDYPYSHNRL